jgi:hypothetical protein
MSYLRSFIPWIIFSVIPDWKWGALAALALMVVQIRHASRDGKPASSLEVVSAAFFAVVALVAFTSPHSPFHTYVGASSSAVLALMAWGGIAVHKPFTLAIARRQADRPVWDTPGFYRTNVIITSAWGTAFTLSAAAALALEANHGSSLAKTIVQAAGIVLPLLFTRFYVATVRFRAGVPSDSQAPAQPAPGQRP